MTLPDIDFSSIRLHRKSQANAFEELCCQLAGEEQFDPVRSRFDRKGPGGDGGVECFATLSNGAEVGWQVKYYWDIASAIKSLDESLTKALSKHPKMTRFVACIPIDLSDSRKEDVVTALSRWDSWKSNRIAQSLTSGRTIEIVRWDAYELKLRLTASNPTAAGRVAYWFDQTLLTTDWFRERFDRTRVELGDRYSPETHIDLPIRRVIEATARDPRLYEDLAAFGQAIALKLSETNQANEGAVAACREVIQKLAQAAKSKSELIPVAVLRASITVAQGSVLAWHRLEKMFASPTLRNPIANEISNLLSTFDSVQRELALEHWDHIGTRALLIVGDSGSGKSHLLGDVCDHAIAKERPAIMVLSGKLTDGEPWTQIIQELGLPKDLQAQTFLAALNAAGQASGVRALLMIDALNERNGQAVWPERLAGLLHDVRRYEWVSLVLSCRSTYEHFVIPDALDDNVLPRIEHNGFTEQQARQYLKKRGISLAEEPNSVEELQVPLFLRICCDAVQLGENAILTSKLGGVTAIFNLYSNAVVKRVTKQVGAAPLRRFVERAINAFAQEMADTGLEEVTSSRAYELISAFYPPVISAQGDLIFQLQNEGMLAAHPSSDDGGEEVLRFTFQRMSDHFIAKNLLDRSVIDGDVFAAFSSETSLLRALRNENSVIVPGLLEAFAVQLPERYGVELNDVPDLEIQWGSSDFFKESLLTRSDDSFSDRTWTLVEEVGGVGLRFDTLIALATDPGRTHNAESLHKELCAWLMPQRDAIWSRHLAESSGHALRLIEWVATADQNAIRPERAALAGLQLCWFLTTTSRMVRDTATKSLVALLTDRPSLARSLWSRFRNLDDAYVTERLVAAIYGAAMQGRWKPGELKGVAEDIYADLFANGEFPPNVLTRDHARGLIKFAESKGACCEGVGAISSKWPSSVGVWPIEYVTEAQIESYTRMYRGSHRLADEIASSTVFDGDFARYQLDPVIEGWSMAKKGEKPIPPRTTLAQRWLEDFKAVATTEMLAAYEAMLLEMGKVKNDDYIVKRDVSEQAKAKFRTAVGEEIFARWSAEASDWNVLGMSQRPRKRRDELAEFPRAWARKWVCKRAHDLGWSEQLHGEFDIMMRGDRQTHKVERIGKKYQWIALYDLIARLADNLEPLPGRKDEDEVLRLRNIDPTLLVRETHDDGWRRFEEPSFWTPKEPDWQPAKVEQALDWLHSNQDIIDGADNITVANPVDGRRWLVLNGFETWRSQGSAHERQTWRRIGCLVVRKNDLEKALDLFEGEHFQGSDDLPSARGGDFRSYLGEHPWSWQTGAERNGYDDEWITDWRPRGITKEAVCVRPTTASYMAEAAGYDGSISQNIELKLPAGWLMTGLGLHLTDGASILYSDSDGHVRFMDPSVAMTGRSAALVDQEAFLSFLNREELVAIWVLAGEKNVYGTDHGRGFGGRLTFSRVFHTHGSEVVALDRYQTFDEPSDEQLAELRDVELRAEAFDVN